MGQKFSVHGHAYLSRSCDSTRLELVARTRAAVYFLSFTLSFPRFDRRYKKSITHKPSPSSVDSRYTSKSNHPFGLSKVSTRRTSYKSLNPVPARAHSVAGVYESSDVKLR
ncbi:hypothetical protein K439DRAFT_748612 [Ramaria rubella]|nr:hypothetical protein K439DRAFT_748612 [Ramaria rubella]